MNSAACSPHEHLIYGQDTGVRSSGSGVGRKINRPQKTIVSLVASCVFFALCSSVPVHAGLLKPDVSYSNYQTPLLLQMVDRIKAKIAARLGPGENRRDRYFIIPFAYQNTERNRGALLEPVDYKKDLYGFVYAPAVDSRGVYNPFRNASAYHD
jgi:hypothetical protein